MTPKRILIFIDLAGKQYTRFSPAAKPDASFESSAGDLKALFAAQVAPSGFDGDVAEEASVRRSYLRSSPSARFSKRTPDAMINSISPR